MRLTLAPALVWAPAVLATAALASAAGPPPRAPAPPQAPAVRAAPAPAAAAHAAEPAAPPAVRAEAGVCPACGMSGCACGCGGDPAKCVCAAPRPAAKRAAACPACGKEDCGCGCGGDPELCGCTDEAYTKARREAVDAGRPLAVYVNQKASPVRGCVACRWDGYPLPYGNSGANVVVGVPRGAGDLAEAAVLSGWPAADAIRAAAFPPPPPPAAPAPQPFTAAPAFYAPPPRPVFAAPAFGGFGGGMRMSGGFSRGGGGSC